MFAAKTRGDGTFFEGVVDCVAELADLVRTNLKTMYLEECRGKASSRRRQGQIEGRVGKRTVGGKTALVQRTCLASFRS